MGRYILKRILLIIPTMFGIMLISFAIIQFAPGGPVERDDRADHRARTSSATARIGGSAAATAVGRRAAQSTQSAGEVSSKYRGAQGLDPEFIKSLEKQFGFDKPAHERFFLMIKNYLMFDFGKSYFRDVAVLQLDQGEDAGLHLTRLVDDAASPNSISIPLGIRKAVHDGEQFDNWTSGVMVVGYAIPGFLFAVLLLVLFAGGIYFQWFPLARPNVGQLGAALDLGKVGDYSGIWCCR